MTAGYKRPESVLVVVCTRAGEVLLLERTRPHGFWQSVTGSLEWRESAARAAQRELCEETGLCGTRPTDCRRGALFPIIPPWRARYAPGVYCNREHWYRLLLPTRRMIRLNPAEHRQYRWLSLAAALRRASSWSNRAALRQAFALPPLAASQQRRRL